jgi:hypothetical protein
LTVEPWEPGGEHGAGGNGGHARAVLDVSGTGTVRGTATAQGGAGAYKGGNGGNASVALTGSGETVELTGEARGGWADGQNGNATGSITGTAGKGGLTGRLTLSAGYDGDAGGDLIVRDPFTVATTGPLVLSLVGSAGGPAFSGDGPAGRAGRADLEVTVASARRPWPRASPPRAHGPC